MRQTGIVLVLIAVLSLAALADGAAEERDRDMIADNLQIYAESVSAGDAESWLALHEPQAYKMPQNEPMFTIASVQDTQQQKFNAMQATYNVNMDIEPMDIHVEGDIAYAMGTYIIDMKPRGDAPPNLVDGKFLTVFRRQDDGTWKVWRDCFNNNTPPPQ
jgi:ketosteroid isomerase-like protein